MVETLQVQIDKLRTAINGLEAQWAVLGDEIVNIALDTLKKQLVALEQQAAALKGDQGQAGIPADERRLVTILFTDMLGSTSNGEKLNPEEWCQKEGVSEGKP